MFSLHWIEKLSVRMRTVLAAAGFACLYSIVVVFFYYDWIFDLAVAVDTVAYAALLNGCLCLGAVFVFFAARRLRTDRLLIAGGCAGYLGAALSLACLAGGGEAGWAYAAGACAGWGAGVLMPLWFDRVGALPGNRFAVVLGWGSLASALGALAIDTLPLSVHAALCLLLVAASVTALIALAPTGGLASSGETEEAASSGDSLVEAMPAPLVPVRAEGPTGLAPGCASGPSPVQAVGPSPQPWRALLVPLLYVLLLSVIYGVLDTVAMAAATVPASGSGFASQVGGLATIVVFLLYVHFEGKRYALLLNAALAAIATGLLFLPFLGDAYRVAMVVLTHMGWEMALLVSYALVIEALRGDRRLLIGWAALVFAIPRPGVVAGVGLATAVSAGGSYAFAQMTVVVFALLYLIITAVWLLRTSEKRTADRAIRRRDELIRRYAQARDDLYALACEEVAGRAGLTKRETELLRLLAQGRDAAHIEKELFLSRNTIKSYTRSVYGKLGVHSKQELIDLVKASLPVE